MNALRRSRALLLAAAFLATVTYAVMADESDTLYSCCGSEDTPLNERCRYLDRGSTCNYGGDCNGDEFGTCCTNKCFLKADG